MQNEDRVFLDTVTLANCKNVMDKLERLINEGYTLVIPNTVLDVQAFQDSPEWLEMQLTNGCLVIQMWLTPDQMTSKSFMWSSCGINTNAADCFDKAIENLPNKEGIMMVKELMELYGLTREEWNPGSWSAPEPIKPEHQELLGLPDGATRTQVLAACKFTGHMEVFDEYNVGYNRGLATQHHCGMIMATDGSVMEV